MNYMQYKISRNLAWEILLNEEVDSLPVKVNQLCRNMGIMVKLYNPANGNSGCSSIINQQPVILVNQSEPLVRQRFTVAHELGHVLLGHAGEYQLVSRNSEFCIDDSIENEANVFASRLLAPSCVLWGCKVKTADDISQLCEISHQAAQFRMMRMNVLYKRNMFLTSPLEKEVYLQFLPYIRKYRL